MLFRSRWVFVAACGLSLVAESGGYSSSRGVGFSLRWLLLLRSMGSRHADFSSCGSKALERTGLAVPRHVGSSRTRARTRVSCIGRQILNHCATREAPASKILLPSLLSHSPNFCGFVLFKNTHYCLVGFAEACSMLHLYLEI